MKKFWCLIGCLFIMVSMSACGSMEEEGSSSGTEMSVSEDISSASQDESSSSSVDSQEEISSSESGSSSEEDDLATTEEAAAIQAFLRRTSLEGEPIEENNASDAALAMAGYQLSVQNARELSDGEFGIEKSVFEQCVRDYFGYSIANPQGLTLQNSPIYFQDGYYRWYGFGFQSACSTTVRSARKLGNGRYQVETDADFYEFNDDGTRTELGVAKGTYVVEEAPDSPYGYHLISQKFTDLPN